MVGQFQTSVPIQIEIPQCTLLKSLTFQSNDSKPIRNVTFQNQNVFWEQDTLNYDLKSEKVYSRNHNGPQKFIHVPAQ